MVKKLILAVCISLYLAGCGLLFLMLPQTPEGFYNCTVQPASCFVWQTTLYVAEFMGLSFCICPLFLIFKKPSCIERYAIYLLSAVSLAMAALIWFLRFFSDIWLSDVSALTLIPFGVIAGIIWSPCIAKR